MSQTMNRGLGRHARRFRTATLVLAVFTGAAHAQDGGDDAGFQKMIDSKGAALVTVKFVLKVKMGGMMGGMGDQENEMEVTGVMIEPGGLVLCANSSMGGLSGMMSRFMGGGMTATPTDIKVLIGDDTEGLEAKLLARDSDLDLAWVQIKEPGDKQFEFVDFTNGPKAKVGQRLLSLNRLDKHFDRALVVTAGRVGGVAKKPRELYLPADDFTGMGQAVFTPDGAAVGFSIMQLPDQEGDFNPMRMMSMSSLSNMSTGKILPAAEVLKATELAKRSPSPDDAGKEGVEIKKDDE